MIRKQDEFLDESVVFLRSVGKVHLGVNPLKLDVSVKLSRLSIRVENLRILTPKIEA
jgi:hypothetical protein